MNPLAYRHHHQLVRWLLLLAVVLLAISITVIPSASAQTIADPVPCTAGVGDTPALIAAIELGNALSQQDGNPVTITLQENCTYYVETPYAYLLGSPQDASVALDTGLPPITGKTVIQSSGAQPATIERLIPASGVEPAKFRHFAVQPDAALTLINVRLTNGAVCCWGGSIYNEGRLTLSGSALSGNTAEFGGAIYNFGTLIIENSTFSGNTAFEHWPYFFTGSGGAILNRVNGTLSITDSTFSGNTAKLGGAIDNFGTLLIENSTFSGNIAGRVGGAIITDCYYVKCAADNGSLTIANSTFSDNSAGEDGGAIGSLLPLSIASSTFSGNSADSGGAIATSGRSRVDGSTFSDNTAESGGGIFNVGPLDIHNSTFSGNTANVQGGGIHNAARELNVAFTTIAFNRAASGGGISNNDESATSNIKASLIAHNTRMDGVSPSQCSGRISLDRHSLAYPDRTCGAKSNKDPQLGPLADNGGPTKTHAPDVTSPTVDAIPVRACKDLDDEWVQTDQRGVERPKDGDGVRGSGCDIGAVERQSASHP